MLFCINYNYYALRLQSLFVDTVIFCWLIPQNVRQCKMDFLPHRRTVSRYVFTKQKFEFLNFVFHFMELIVNSPPI